MIRLLLSLTLLWVWSVAYQQGLGEEAVNDHSVDKSAVYRGRDGSRFLRSSGYPDRDGDLANLPDANGNLAIVNPCLDDFTVIVDEIGENVGYSPRSFQRLQLRTRHVAACNQH